MRWKLLWRAALAVESVQALIVGLVTISTTLLVLSFLQWLAGIFSVGVVITAIGVCIAGAVLNFAVIRPTLYNYKTLVELEIKNKGKEK